MLAPVATAPKLGNRHELLNINQRITHLAPSRALVMSGDTAKAKTAYQDFLTFWKEADPDIPILQQAKAEYAKLQ